MQVFSEFHHSNILQKIEPGATDDLEKHLKNTSETPVWKNPQVHY